MIKTIKIEGMSCNHCVKHVESALNEINGVKAKVNLESKTAVVNIDKEIDDVILKKAVEEVGYSVVSIN